VKIGDLVKANHHDSVQPTFWYRDMLETGRPAIVVGLHETHAGQAYIEIHYNGFTRIVMKENVEVISES
jgi:hypothetical protein